MGLGTFFIIMVIFGLISMFIENLTGINPYVIYTAVGSLILIFSLFLTMFSGISGGSPYDIMRIANSWEFWLRERFPSTILGELAGGFLISLKNGLR